jgi:chromosome segregation ATPase
MGTPHKIRQRQYAERQHERGLRLRRIWLSDDQTSAVRSLLRGGPANGHSSVSEADLVATREALRQAQSDLAQAQARVRDLETRLSAAPPPQALARIHDLEADLAQLSRVNAALRANLSDAQRATRTAIAGVVVVGAIFALALLTL